MQLTRSIKSVKFFSICWGGSLLIKSKAQSSCWSDYNWNKRHKADQFTTPNSVISQAWPIGYNSISLMFHDLLCDILTQSTSSAILKWVSEVYIWSSLIRFQKIYRGVHNEHLKKIKRATQMEVPGYLYLPIPSDWLRQISMRVYSPRCYM